MTRAGGRDASVVTEPHEGRLELAEKLGARRAAEHEGDFLFVSETSGAPPAWKPAWKPAFAAVANTGTLVVIGQTATPLPIVTNTVVQRQITIRGTLIYDHPQDYAAALQAVGGGAIAAEATVRAGSRRRRRLRHSRVPAMCPASPGSA